MTIFPVLTLTYWINALLNVPVRCPICSDERPAPVLILQTKMLPRDILFNPRIVGFILRYCAAAHTVYLMVAVVENLFAQIVVTANNGIGRWAVGKISSYLLYGLCCVPIKFHCMIWIMNDLRSHRYNFIRYKNMKMVHSWHQRYHFRTFSDTRFAMVLSSAKYADSNEQFSDILPVLSVAYL